MKRKLAFVLLTALLLCLSFSPPAFAASDFGHVTDAAGLLNDSQTQTLESAASELSERYACGIYIVTVNNYLDYTRGDVMDCAEELYTYYDLGYGSGRDGLILLLSMAERDYALVSHGEYGNYLFGDHNKDLIEGAFLDDFHDDDWNGGFSDYLNLVEDIMATASANSLGLEDEDVRLPGSYYSGNTYHYGVTGKLPVPAKVAIGIGLPCILALIVCSTLKAQMKTAKLRTTAEEYVIPGSANLRIREDRFINRTETRTRIQSDSGSGRSGGGGGGGFSGHSGKF